MAQWKTDDELIEMMKSSLYTPVVGDILDQHGCYHQFLPPNISPLVENMVLAGRAMPVLQIDVFGDQEKPFGKMTQALDDLRPNEVYIATGGTQRSANWGEIMTATAKKRGAAGAVIDGYHRDTSRVLDQNWPVFSRGSFAQDSAPRTKVVEFRCPIEIDKVWIEPGDLVFADRDGVVIVPQRLEVEILEESLKKARGEKVVRQEIEQGMPSTMAFEKYGIL